MVKYIPVPDLRRNAIALAKVAALLKIPVITSAPVPGGPNGPLIPEIHQAAPHAQYVGRRGEINVWDSPDFVKAVEATGRKTLIIAGTLTTRSRLFQSCSRPGIDRRRWSSPISMLINPCRITGC